jgi:hypothetical protein
VLLLGGVARCARVSLVLCLILLVALVGIGLCTLVGNGSGLRSLLWFREVDSKRECSSDALNRLIRGMIRSSGANSD